MYKHAFLSLTVMFLVNACSSDPRPPAILDETFTTDIMDNGLKMFSYSLTSAPQKHHAMEKKPRQVKPNATGRQKRTGTVRSRSQDQSSRSMLLTQAKRQSYDAVMKQLIDEKLTLKLAATGYCREGHIILETYIGNTNSQLRGECNEGASELDRHKFSNN
jgi:hypothetical protein